jgi:CHASE3 domain sensor protein
MIKKNKLIFINFKKKIGNQFVQVFVNMQQQLVNRLQQLAQQQQAQQQQVVLVIMVTMAT